MASLPDIVAQQPVGTEVHVIMDNLSDHKTKRMRECFTEHPPVHLHFTPAYSLVLEPVGAVISEGPAGCDHMRGVHAPWPI